jgi:hypothetical protein
VYVLAKYLEILKLVVEISEHHVMNFEDFFSKMEQIWWEWYYVLIIMFVLRFFPSGYFDDKYSLSNPFVGDSEVPRVEIVSP